MIGATAHKTQPLISFTAMNEAALLTILQQHWGHSAFRTQQLEVIQSVLAGKDTLALLPTGGGKSLCYQVPAMAQEGICIVVSPLIALMQDQVAALNKKGIPALLLHTGMSRRMMVQTLKNAGGGHYKFLYCSPERLQTPLFLEYLPGMPVTLLAVDEAHCISQWGFDFRPAYRKIAALREELPRVPVLALTASATPQVQQDICEQLHFPASAAVFKPSFERPNLSYSVNRADSKLQRLVEIVQAVKGPAIVYCNSRKRTAQVAKLLCMHGVDAQFYHAGLSAEERSQKQDVWMQGRSVMVCTNAFGMGIDKNDVRLVVHADVPHSVEAYYQEAGRAGRDGQKAYAVLLYAEKDVQQLQEAPAQHFPAVEEVRKLYEALVNYLQIPAYSGDGQSFDFHFQTFVKAFGLEPLHALYCLKALELDGWLALNDRVFTPATVLFTCNRASLETFLAAQPAQEALVLHLLRNYEGLFDHPAFISEKKIAQQLRLKEEEVVAQLKSIASFGMIQYDPPGDAPQLMFLKQRVPAKDLFLNQQRYGQLKKAFAQRIQHMLEYIKEQGCRSAFINTYFGAPTTHCGVCDNCIARKKAKLARSAFIQLATAMIDKAAEPVPPDELFRKLGIQKEEGWKVVRYLQSEQKLVSTQQGWLQAVRN